jgi:hypothetical protein
MDVSWSDLMRDLDEVKAVVVRRGVPVKHRESLESSEATIGIVTVGIASRLSMKD